MAKSKRRMYPRTSPEFCVAWLAIRLWMYGDPSMNLAPTKMFFWRSIENSSKIAAWLKRTRAKDEQSSTKSVPHATKCMVREDSSAPISREPIDRTRVSAQQHNYSERCDPRRVPNAIDPHARWTHLLGHPAEENDRQLKLRVADQPEPVTIPISEIESGKRLASQ